MICHAQDPAYYDNRERGTGSESCVNLVNTHLKVTVACLNAPTGMQIGRGVAEYWILDGPMNGDHGVTITRIAMMTRCRYDRCNV